MSCPVPRNDNFESYLKDFPSLKPPDLAVFFCTLVISAAIGVIFTCSEGRQQTVDEFLMANKRMHWLPVGISLLSSFQSAITIVGTPLEVYKYGTTHVWILISYPIAIWISLSLFIPVLYKSGYNTVNQYLKERFNHVIAYISLGFFVLTQLFYLSLVLYVPSAVFDFVTGSTNETNIYMIFTVGMCCIAYTTLGGTKTVIWTDVFQFTVMVTGVMVIIVYGLVKEGKSVFLSASNSGRLDFVNYYKIFNPAPKMRYSVMTLAFGNVVAWTSLFSATQTQVQRAWTLKSLLDIRKAFILNSVGLPLLNLLCCIIGLIVYSQYKLCDPLQEKFHQNNLTGHILLPYYVMDNFADSTGLAGLITVAIVAGSASTLMSGINSVATCIYYDVLLDVLPNHSKVNGVVISKLTGVLFGLLVIVVSIGLHFYDREDSIYLTGACFVAIFGGPVLGLFSLGLFTKKANALGSGISFIISTAVTIAVGASIVTYADKYPQIMSLNFTKECCYNGPSFQNVCCSNVLNQLQNTTINNWSDSNLWHIDWQKGEFCYQFVAFIGLFTVLLVGLPLSIIIDKVRKHEGYVSDHLQSDLRQIFFFLPQSFRRKIHFLRDLEDTRYEPIIQVDEEFQIYKTIYDWDGKVLFIIRICQSDIDDTEMGEYSESSSDELSESESLNISKVA